ncbi:hypothetical protein PI124_g2538 [Phytophthora idaei]|nr:hypothetical protein PI126_g5275 [Phytophthora idaei]KAG3252879.1 hypothetical protein PI124_g2538 [Phytophthora idaei]
MSQSNYVRNCGAQRRLQNHEAPVTNAGTALNNEALTDANLKRIKRDLVTANEVADARKREHGTLAEMTASA